PPTRITPEAFDMLCGHNWTGNVRELHNVLARAFPLCKGAAIEPHDLALDVRLQIKPGESLLTLKKRANYACERKLVMYFLARNGGKITESAEDCGTERRTFLAVVMKHKLPHARVRRSRTDRSPARESARTYR